MKVRSFTEIVVDLVYGLTILLMKRDDSLMDKQALSIIFESKTYQKLVDERNLLYVRNLDDLFSMLEKELDADDCLQKEEDMIPA